MAGAARATAILQSPKNVLPLGGEEVGREQPAGLLVHRLDVGLVVGDLEVVVGVEGPRPGPRIRGSAPGAPVGPTAALTGGNSRRRVNKVGLRDITGVLSRYFVLGYFVPAFFTLLALSQWLTSAFIPDHHERLGTQTQVLVLGGGALLAGLVLLGLRYPVIRIFEGYPLEFGPLRRLRRPLIWLQGKSFDRLDRIRKDNNSPRRATAIRLIDRRFHKDRARLLPTRLGNALRAAENYPYTRWGLDGVAAWPRIDALLSEREQELHGNAMSDLAFFLNGSIGALLAGLIFIADEAANAPIRVRYGALYAVPFLLAYVLYRAAIGAAERLGTERRASIDLHRRELYTRLGVRSPASFSEERTRIAPAVNQCLLYRVAIPDEYAAASQLQGKEANEGGR